MSASWKLTADLGGNRTVELVWGSRSDPCVRGFVLEGKDVIEEKDFVDQSAAEEWITSLGVGSLVASETIHAYPLAERIKVIFPGAPEEKVIARALVDVLAGATLADVAAQMGAHPTIVRAWLIGFAPESPHLQGWRIRKRKK